MAAPDYVPNKTAAADRHYVSPPRRPQPWLADRPAELTDGQPMGAGLGVPGPDQGYALRLARRFEGDLLLGPGEHADDAISGCVGVALKRAALFGRAPVSADLEVAFRVFGFLPPAPEETLVAWRKELFAGVSHPHHYAEARHLVELVPEAALRMAPSEVEAACLNNRDELLAVSISR
ncbi:MAG: hypothetical protein F4Z06_11510 [Acidimicrobiia bacterium]|nr:hypothetical protein [Acidimicrobiia bacterium]MYE73738.1 hypothetical protein [Acidimicrobiia bacterium]MYJ63728.1 hypothetical protein [Acidimicrobiia bacterium]